MLFWITIKLSLKSLWIAKLRSFLAILGIIMGVGAVISMLSIVEGARRQMQTMIGSLGTDVLYIWPDYRSVQGRGAAPLLKLADARAVLVDAPSVIRVSPQLSSSVAIKFGNKNTRVSMDGVAPSYLTIRNMEVEKGRAFSDGEVQQAARVAILGPKTVEKLFGTLDPLGQNIKVNQLIFRVIGVFKARGAQGPMGNEDDRIVAPFTTVQNQVLGRRANLQSICVQAQSTEALRLAEEQARVILRKQHRLKADAKDDFAVFNQAQLLDMQNRAVGIFSIVLGGVGGICLFTGGIGIMNIMLVIVTERTREIGLRKAIGARNRDILTQFLLEAVLMSAIGGLLGVLGGSGLSLLISTITPLKTAVSPQSVVLALSFAAGIGIFFGYYPALRAARLDPIEALHTE
jgi:putative ABC transport system permease protein